MSRIASASRSKHGRSRLLGLAGTLLLLSLAAATLGRAAQVRARMGGASVSGMLLQNLDASQEAWARVRLDPRGGGRVLEIRRPGIPAGGTERIAFSPEVHPTHGVYAGIVAADRDLGLLVRTDWGATGAAAYYEGARAATELLVPLFKSYTLRGVGAMPRFASPHDSIVDVQNTDAFQPVEAQLELRDSSGRLVTRWERRIDPGRSIGVDAASEPALAGLPNGFAGSLRVRAATPLAASSLVDLVHTDKGVAAVQVGPVALAAPRLHAPLVGSGPLESWMAVLNPGPSPARLELSYRGNEDATGSACPSAPILHGGRSWTIAAGGMAIFAQGAGGGSGLPRGCLGSARLDADQPLLAYVLVEPAGAGTSAAYLASTEVEAHPRVFLPGFRYRDDHEDVNTAVQLLNPGSEAQDVRLSVFRGDGTEVPCPGCRVRLSAGASWFWYPPSITDLQAWPRGQGSARVEASGAVLALAYEYTPLYSTDTAIYRGLSLADASAHPRASAARYAPYFAEVAERAPTATPDPAAHRIYLPDLRTVQRPGGGAP